MPPPHALSLCSLEHTVVTGDEASDQKRTLPGPIKLGVARRALGEIKNFPPKGLSYLSDSRKAALASKRVESSVGSGQSLGSTSKGISVQPRTTA